MKHSYISCTVWIGLAFFSAAGYAQSTVTTSGGSSGAVPVFNGSATVTNSPITVSGSNVGIGTTSPGANLEIDNTSWNPSLVVNGAGVWTPEFRLYSSGLQPAIEYPSNGVLRFATITNSAGAGFAEVLRISGSGNVGIGTTTPGSTLEVNGNVKLTSGSGASLTFADGTKQTTAWTGVLCGGDYAESVEVTGTRDHYGPGDVMVVDPDTPGNFLRASEPYSTLVAGIYSTKPGAIGKRSVDSAKAKDEIPMAMIGIVPTKVSAENGPVKPGDLLVTSTTPGYAMRGTDRNRMTGAIVGKALGSVQKDTGIIEVLVTLQ